MNRVAALHPYGGSAAAMPETTDAAAPASSPSSTSRPSGSSVPRARRAAERERALGPCAPTASALAARHVALLFDKPSLRTRTTFEVAIRELGGQALVLPADVALGEREPVADVARNLERWVHGVVIRTFAQQIVEDFASAAPQLAVINALTDQEHPCQALADYQALQEHVGTLAGRTIAYVGDGNNVATSLVHAGA
jgi:ornithine carbamoyltransferase